MKIFIIIIVFIIAIILIAFSFSLLFQQKDDLIRYNTCVLLQNPETQKVDCYGCVGDICKDAPVNWIQYEKPEVGIPYACYEGPKGCELSQ